MRRSENVVYEAQRTLGDTGEEVTADDLWNRRNWPMDYAKRIKQRESWEYGGHPGEGRA